MAIYNEILVARYSRMLQKLFGMKGGVPVKQLAGELSVALPLFNGTENRYLEGWNRFNAGIQLTASVGNINAFQLRNPGGSNVIAVLEKIFISTSATTINLRVVSSGATSADLTTAIALTASRLDVRGNAQPTLIFSDQQAAAAPADLADTLTFLWIGQAAGGVPQAEVLTTDIQEIPLLPGDALRIRGNTANLQDFLQLIWRERFLEESERT